MNIVNVCVFFLVVSDENKNREKMRNDFSNFVALETLFGGTRRLQKEPEVTIIDLLGNHPVTSRRN